MLMSWSGGKDGALALHELRASGAYRAMGLLTTFTEASGSEPSRVQMHGLRREMIEGQAEALGLDLVPVTLPRHASNTQYAEAMTGVLLPERRSGLRQIGFGDIHLADLRSYREHQLISLGMKGVFPLWKRDTRALLTQFIDQGFRAVICCVDPKALDPSFLGRELDGSLLADLPEGVDPCGERGEFHSFVYAGPGFGRVLGFKPGERFEDRGFAYLDLLPA